jgi:hypothetical protein
MLINFAVSKIKLPSFGEKRPKLPYTKISRFTVNCEIDQHDKFYLPANVQQNRITGVGVMTPEM